MYVLTHMLITNFIIFYPKPQIIPKPPCYHSKAAARITATAAAPMELSC